MVGDTIEAAVEIYASQRGRDLIASWRENDVAGRFLVGSTLEKSGRLRLIADISTLNFNVTYEIGYAIGAGRRVFIVKNKSIAGNYKLKHVGIFDTLWLHQL